MMTNKKIETIFKLHQNFLFLGVILVTIFAAKPASAQIDVQFYTGYRSYTDITDKVNALYNGYHNTTDLNISIISIGNSYEGRDMKVLRFTSPEGAATGKPALFLRAGIHAAEQVGVLSSMYAVENLMYEYEQGDPAATEKFR